jgi:hypothetical protein
LLYGDRDFRCNWFGGQAISLATPHAGRSAFASAGYAPVVLAGHPGSVPRADANRVALPPSAFVRQAGRLAFARVLQAGHEAPLYQPAALLALFRRTLGGYDLATGTVRVGKDYATRGPSSVEDVRQPPPPEPAPECYVLSDQLRSCSEGQVAALLDGSAVVKDYIVIQPAA